MSVLSDLFQQIADAIRYVEDGGESVTITWDGDTTGKTSINPDEDYKLYKVSDLVLTDDKIRTGTITVVSADGTVDDLLLSSIWGNMVDSGWVTSDDVVIPTLAFFAKKDTDFAEAGVYFSKRVFDDGSSYFATGFTNGASSAPICALDFPARIRALKGGEPETITITWDGDTTGKWYREDVMEGTTLITCKVSDIVLTDEEIRAGSYTQNFWGETVLVADEWDDRVSNGQVTEDYVALQGITFVRKDNTLLPSGYVAPEKGVYYASMNGTVICNNFTTTRRA